MAKNFINSDPYWKDKKRELDALSVFYKKEFGDMIAYFDTNSCAAFHWLPLHEIIIKYYLKIMVMIKTMSEIGFPKTPHLDTHLL